MDRLDYAIRDIKYSIDYVDKEINGLKTYKQGLTRALEIMESLGMDK